MSEIEKVVMTPKCKSANSTTLIIERQAIEAQANDKVHVAGGDHTGIIINKEQKIANGLTEPCHNQLEFRVYLVNASNGTHTREARCLRFWFKPQLPPIERAHTAQNFFRELVSPQDFPRDYVGFIKKIMKLMQNQFLELRLLEIELRQEGSGSPPTAFIGDSVNNHLPAISEDKVLEFIESAYPNPITIDDFVARSSGKWSVEEVKECLQALENRGLAKALTEASYTRQHSVDTKVVGQMPTISSARQPTIAVITALFCEKLAVDAMMDSQETYVRYTTIGESNVYTLGTIGSHRVVSTKLPTVGHTREAMTAAGNTTTRLLGTFQKVDYVFLVGVGGGVPHYTDYNKHIRLGDVVVSTSPEDLEEKYVYMYCEKAVPNNIGGWDYEVKPYKPASFYLQDIALKLCDGKNPEEPWNKHFRNGLDRLGDGKQQWAAPEGDTDRLCVNLGDGAVIEVSHPTGDGVDGVYNGSERNVRRVLCAAVCGGRAAGEAGGQKSGAREAARAHFATHARALAFDCELDAVVESVIGNRRDCFISIRGISDYWDGTRGKDWQPHASLAAAAVMKAIICAMEPPNE